MRAPKSTAVFLIALFALSTSATAQKIYKCGNTYSEKACPDGVIIPVELAPQPAQKKAADQATRRDALTADRMEKARLQQEKINLTANTPKLQGQARPPETDTGLPPILKKRKVKSKLQEFRAVVPGTMTTKKRSKK